MHVDTDLGEGCWEGEVTPSGRGGGRGWGLPRGGARELPG